MIKHLLLFLLFFINFLSLGQSPVEKNGNLSVQGNMIVNEKGIPVSLAGCSLFWSNTGWGGAKFYNKDVVKWLKKDWRATIIRAAMGVEAKTGYLDDPSNKERVETVVEAAIENGMYVLIDWHSHHAEKYTGEAIEFFKGMAEKYGENPNVIYEIYNEPLEVSWSKTVKPYAEKVIKEIRKIDPDNLIIVGTPNWSQDVDSAAGNPVTGYKNIAYTLHFYAASHKDFLMKKAQYAIDKGLPLFVTEWGTVKANGHGKVDYESTEKWMEFLCKNKLSHCNWAINNKHEGASALKHKTSATGNWKDSDLTPSGIFVRAIIRGWKERCNKSN